MTVRTAFALGLLIAGPVMAQDLPSRLVVIDVRELMSNSWKELGGYGASYYSYQITHAIKYAKSPRVQQNKNVDAILMESVRGSNGSIAETSLSYIAVTCYPNGSFPNKVTLVAQTTFDTDDRGLPAAPVHNYFRFDPTQGSALTVQQNSVVSALQRTICSDKSIPVDSGQTPTGPLTVTLDANLIDTRYAIVRGRTNLPDGTLLFMELTGNGPSLTTKAHVVDGEFLAEPILSPNGPALHGPYRLTIRSAAASEQKPTVVAEIGQDGSKLSGPLVNAGVATLVKEVQFP